jgi:hypothetical protein
MFSEEENACRAGTSVVTNGLLQFGLERAIVLSKLHYIALFESNGNKEPIFPQPICNQDCNKILSNQKTVLQPYG